MTQTSEHRNADSAEIGKFSAVAARWWDPAGEFKPLHEINPLRAQYIAERCSLDGARVLDVGCGGGLLSEALAKRGAIVTGLDMSPEALEVARLHSLESGVEIDYQLTTAEEWALANADAYDVVCCLEMLEHVPAPESVVSACAQLVKPGGEVFFSTINRNAKAYALAVVAAEYLLRLLPRGTHDFEKFIKPSELAAYCRAASLELRDLQGIRIDPFAGMHSLGSDTSVNYLMHVSRADRG